MSTRTILRSLVHKIVTHPDVPPRFAARCVACGWVAESSTDDESVDMECLAHAGRSNHRQFTRTVVSRAFVVREGESPEPPPAP
ncbi:DUF7848 domain-containing protein [Streptomyces californicus]